jgi:sugar phosphate isomerase/epimerase
MMHLIRPFCAAVIVVAAIIPLASAQESSPKDNIFARKNLVAWCIVPFDGKNRGPAERAEMVKQLGFLRVAYDWRANHVATFEEEILQYKKHGIEYFAFWATHDKAFELFAKHDLHPQIWQTAPSPNAATNEERVALAVKQLLPLVERTGKMKCKLGLYNHGGWGGEPNNLVAVCAELRKNHRANHVGIVYNLHHGHGHIKDFDAALKTMKPYLLCVNLNGMATEGAGPKILQLGAGEHDVKLLRSIRDSGYTGPIGIIGHTNDDVELRLRDNLDGLDWILPQLTGKAAGPRPKYRTR